ncbi:MAG: hypothetical protein A2Y24_08310 [Clostridiales bacterium GWE2_32_10]|nr:MAG: hypothetical protein A2Y24_08310 [Clostridiales bacterium GWE2_32_10]HBY21627.1 hypothetical protein [Clostridiales bacterium]
MKEMVKLYTFKKEIKENKYRMTEEDFLRQLVEFPNLGELRETSIELLTDTATKINSLRHDDHKRERYENEMLYLDKVKRNTELLQDYMNAPQNVGQRIKFESDITGLYKFNKEIERKEERLANMPRILSFEKEKAQIGINEMKSIFEEKIQTSYEETFKGIFESAGLDFDIPCEEKQEHAEGNVAELV